MQQKHTNIRKAAKEVERLQYPLVDFFQDSPCCASHRNLRNSFLDQHLRGKSFLVLSILIHNSINVQNITLVSDFFVLHLIKYLTTFNK